ncbi:MAG: hypothetical protein KAS38_19975 [Anaerolineales bacterium]|nr:hypothetical protein [Anaerolineales bacterium]MCK5316096.1 hypothetical protein [Anaerolineales bacterium]MCK5429672.1 hypothetical protein [Anaerolineales bacterium]
MNQDQRRINLITGLAILGSLITGILSLIAALFPFLSGEYLSAGVFLIAAALAFGLLANATSRK